MRRVRSASLLLSLVVGCAGNPDVHTLASLHAVAPDLSEVTVEDGLDQAMLGYEKFLQEAPESSLTPEAMRRLADLKLEKEYGLLGESGLREIPAPEARTAPASAPDRPTAKGIADHSESDEDFERRAFGEQALGGSEEGAALELPGGQSAAAGPLEAIALYDEILETYPHYAQNDQVLYQKARAYDELGRPDEAIAVIERLVTEYPASRHLDEVQFRRAEYFFMRKKYVQAEESYTAIAGSGPRSEYYELALYKLGWTLYKQFFHEEALDRYIELLDYKVSVGYDFDASQDEEDERRIADTFRVISLSFSNLGGPEVVERYFAAKGPRSYEDRVYSHLGEFYLDKLRYNDAAVVYKAFVALHPRHRSSPHFGMRVVEIYEAGGFPKLVLEAKKEFASTYGLHSEYWRHFDVDDSPEVLSYLKTNLKDLANHYHALYQEAAAEEERPGSFGEALRWYRAYLESFADDEETPGLHHRLADLLLEHGDFGEAAREYERTAYDYAEHEGAPAAGYAAIYAHREEQKHATGEARDLARSEAVESTLRFVAAFPGHEHAAAVLGSAAEDLYEMEHFERAIGAGRKLIAEYPEAEAGIRRSAWAVVAHASFDTAAYPEAETAYARVIEMSPAEDASRQDLVDNLAAAIYKQGEQARESGDSRLAADHFLRIAEAAPTSEIRPLAEYDAAAELIRLEAWTQAAGVLEAFRQSHPDHELNPEATKQMAFVHRQEGDLAGAAEEYERVAAEADDDELGREALLEAGALYEDSELPERALTAYLRYLSRFPSPIETAVEIRFKVAGMYAGAGDEARYHEQLRRIVEVDVTAGGERTARVRYLAGRSALVLSEEHFHHFEEVALVQPFEQNLQEKQRRMNRALDAFAALIDYEVGDVTAAATFYMAEIYFHFSRALLGSERPSDLAPRELQDYEMVLEEEAFPFEERAIDVHEKNLELMGSGVYNAWIEKSFARLGELMPGRYAKAEQSSGWITSVESYAYHAPTAPGMPEELTPSLAEAPAPDPGAGPEAPEGAADEPAVPEPVADAQGAEEAVAGALDEEPLPEAEPASLDAGAEGTDADAQ